MSFIDVLKENGTARLLVPPLLVPPSFISLFFVSECIFAPFNPSLEANVKK